MTEDLSVRSSDAERDLRDRVILGDLRDHLRELLTLHTFVPQAVISVQRCRRMITEIEGDVWWRQQMRDMADAPAGWNGWTSPIPPSDIAVELTAVDFKSWPVGQIPSHLQPSRPAGSVGWIPDPSPSLAIAGQDRWTSPPGATTQPGGKDRETSPPSSHAAAGGSGRWTSSSLASLSNGIPHAVEGEWIDPEACPVFGPRKHPFGLGAWQQIIGGRIVYFPSKADADAFIANHTR